MESMKLVQFRVRNFKSVQDSGVIKCENITNLIGVNEAGKSNLLLALWKLNPARNGEIIFTSDMPVEKLAENIGSADALILLLDKFLKGR